MPVTELRLVVTVDDYDAALAFYRDALGLPARAAHAAPNGGRVTCWTPAASRSRSPTPPR